VTSDTSTGLSQLLPVRHAAEFCRILISPHRKLLLAFSLIAAESPCFAMLYRVLFRNARSCALFDVSEFAGSHTAAVAAMLSAVNFAAAEFCRFRYTRR
jgi:hypothetical protein